MNDAKKRNIQGTIVAFILGLLLGGLGIAVMVFREVWQWRTYDFDIEIDDIIRYTAVGAMGSLFNLLILLLFF